MGCDGGTIPRRDELVRTRQRPEQRDRDSVRAFKWRHCALSQAPLERPVVACELGNLYSKASVLEALLQREGKPATVAHLRGLKDIRALNLTRTCSAKSAGSSAINGDSYIDTHSAEYMCPVVGLEMNGKYRFVVLWACGCVLSERAVNMVKTDQCPRCSAPASQQDVIVLNPEGEELDRMVANMEARRARVKKTKRSQDPASPYSDTEPTGECSNTETATSSSSSSEAPPSKKAKNSKRTRPVKASTSQSINLPQKGKLLDPAFRKASSSYSIAGDEQSTEVYKSLFTTHKTAINKPKAHWVTYNPLFN